MKNYLILFASTLFLLGCRKDGEVVKIDLLSTPLSSTPYGFAGNIGGNYYYVADTTSYYTGSHMLDGDCCRFYYHFSSITSFSSSTPLGNIHGGISVHLLYLMLDENILTDSAFYDYIKIGDYCYLNPSTMPDTGQSTKLIDIESRLGTYPDIYESAIGSNATSESNFEIIDTLHIKFEGRSAIKYRAKINCKLYNSTGTDYRELTKGVVVGLFGKP